MHHACQSRAETPKKELICGNVAANSAINKALSSSALSPTLSTLLHVDELYSELPVDVYIKPQPVLFLCGPARVGTFATSTSRSHLHRRGSRRWPCTPGRSEVDGVVVDGLAFPSRVCRARRDNLRLNSIENLMSGAAQ